MRMHTAKLSNQLRAIIMCQKKQLLFPFNSDDRYTCSYITKYKNWIYKQEACYDKKIRVDKIILTWFKLIRYKYTVESA